MLVSVARAIGGETACRAGGGNDLGLRVFSRALANTRPDHGKAHVYTSFLA